VRIYEDNSALNKEKQKMTHDWVSHTSRVNKVLSGNFGVVYSTKPTTPVYTMNYESVLDVSPEDKAIRKYAHEHLPSKVFLHERLSSRFNKEEAPSINILNHTKMNPHSTEFCQEGGSFPTKTWSKAQERLGTAKSGHSKKYIISDYYQ